MRNNFHGRPADATTIDRHTAGPAPKIDPYRCLYYTVHHMAVDRAPSCSCRVWREVVDN